MVNNFIVPQKVHIESPYDPEILLLGIYREAVKTYAYQNYIQMSKC